MAAAQERGGACSRAKRLRVLMSCGPQLTRSNTPESHFKPATGQYFARLSSAEESAHAAERARSAELAFRKGDVGKALLEEASLRYRVAVCPASRLRCRAGCVAPRLTNWAVCGWMVPCGAGKAS